MNLHKKLMFVFVAVLMGLSFIACSNNDDEPDDGCKSDLIGVWEYAHNDEYEQMTQTYTFEKNGQFSYSIYEKIEGEAALSGSFGGKYSVNNEYITMITEWTDGSYDDLGKGAKFTVKYAIEGNKLMFIDTEEGYEDEIMATFIRKK